MRPSFHPRLVNGPFEDPGLFIPFLFEKRALLFDLGDIHRLAPRDILKLTQVFISHTHMDHFIGFDHLLRLLLGREKELWLFGPEGFLKNLEGKFSAYTWNLVGTYDYPLTIHATEIQSDRRLTQTYHCAKQFLPEGRNNITPSQSIIWQEPGFRIETAMLDHGLPCLGYSLTESFHINICKSGLKKMKLPTGPWLSDFKKAVYTQKMTDEIQLPPRIDGRPSSHKISLEELAQAIAVITPGQKIAYITDTGYQSAEAVIQLAQGADHLFIEAAFLHQHRRIASEKKHLTARQAGLLARRAQVKRLTLFHFSPRYTDEGHLLEKEAREAFLG